MIIATDYIKTAFSVNDADAIGEAIKKAVLTEKKVIIDFTGIDFFTTLFFSSAITSYVFSHGSEKYDEIFEVRGLTEVGQTAYEHSLEFAREEATLTPEERQARLDAIDDLCGE